MTKLIVAPGSKYYRMNFVDPEGWYEGYVNWDGCVHINSYFNEPLPEGKPKQLVDRIHICDLEEYIEMLQGLKELAKQHFETWPG